MRKFPVAAVVTLTVFISACGGGSNGGGGNTGGTVNAPTSYTVGGSVSGLSGTVVLQINGSGDLALASDRGFTFITTVASGSTYNVTVLTQPSNQTCTVTSGSGTIGAANITNVSVTCSNNSTGLGAAVQLSAGFTHTCARFDSGAVKCWGDNLGGQLGLGNSAGRGLFPSEMGFNLPTVDLGTGRKAVDLEAGSSHTCVRLDDQSIKCWGAGGRLGLEDAVARGNAPNQMGDNLPVVNLGTGRVAVKLAAGDNHTCALLENTTVKCWGLNDSGALGLGDTQPRGAVQGQMGDNLPTVDLGTGRTAVEVAAGYDHTCARLDNGTVKCWGANASGQLGLGDTANRGDAPNEMGDNLPIVDLGTGRTAVALAAGLSTSCARLDNGTVKCWGGNGFGRLGLGDIAQRGDNPGEMGDSLPPIDLGDGRTALELAAAFGHTCARLDNGAVKCWGANQLHAELGLGDTSDRGDNPGEMGNNLPQVALGTGRTAVQIVTHGIHTCVRLDDSSVKCWGENVLGQLGLGDQVSRGVTLDQMGDNLPAVDLGK